MAHPGGAIIGGTHHDHLFIINDISKPAEAWPDPHLNSSAKYCPYRRFPEIKGSGDWKA